MNHSILLAHRNRHEHLKLCLDSLALEAAGHEVVIVLVDQSDEPPQIPDYLFGLVWLFRPPYSPPFHKSALLNQAAQHATGELLTVLDADMIVPPQFFSRIEEIHKDNPDAKIGHRVRLLDQAPASPLPSESQSIPPDSTSMQNRGMASCSAAATTRSVMTCSFLTTPGIAGMDSKTSTRISSTTRRGSQQSSPTTTTCYTFGIAAKNLTGTILPQRPRTVACLPRRGRIRQSD